MLPLLVVEQRVRQKRRRAGEEDMLIAWYTSLSFTKESGTMRRATLSRMLSQALLALTFRIQRMWCRCFVV